MIILNTKINYLKLPAQGYDGRKDNAQIELECRVADDELLSVAMLLRTLSSVASHMSPSEIVAALQTASEAKRNGNSLFQAKPGKSVFDTKAVRLLPQDEKFDIELLEAWKTNLNIPLTPVAVAAANIALRAQPAYVFQNKLRVAPDLKDVAVELATSSYSLTEAKGKDGTVTYMATGQYFVQVDTSLAAGHWVLE